MGVSSPKFLHIKKIHKLTAHKQEIRDINNVVTIAIITITVISPGISNATARAKLRTYIMEYVGKRVYQIYVHENTNVISAMIVFNAKGYKEMDISKEIERIK